MRDPGNKAGTGVGVLLDIKRKVVARFQQILRLSKPFRLVDSSMPVIVKVTYW